MADEKVLQAARRFPCGRQSSYADMLYLTSEGHSKVLPFSTTSDLSPSRNASKDRAIRSQVGTALSADGSRSVRRPNRLRCLNPLKSAPMDVNARERILQTVVYSSTRPECSRSKQSRVMHRFRDHILIKGTVAYQEKKKRTGHLPGYDNGYSEASHIAYLPYLDREGSLKVYTSPAIPCNWLPPYPSGNGAEPSSGVVLCQSAGSDTPTMTSQSVN